MPSDLRNEGVRNLEAVQSTNRELLERALRMRAVSYLAQQKANLLTQTIFEIDRSKQALRDHSNALERDQATILRQKHEIEARAAALEELQQTLEERVRKRTQELAQSNEALRREAAERTRIQAEQAELTQKYLRAQKLELVGRLASGVAHDFNNLLTIILGHGELARSELHGGPLQEHLEDIINASRRGAALTQQLLAFAGKQARDTSVIEPARVIGDFAKLLRRVLSSDVELNLDLGADTGSIRASASELEQVVLNLVVNARDAMPSGGTISVSTRRVLRPEDGPLPHKHCVALVVSDTGVGMKPEVMEHAFEPFFTTKPPGVGTGLGLSTVASIVHDCEGSVEVDSQPDGGTTFRVYFPALVSRSDVVAAYREGDAPPRGQEVVLLVDDDESVRAVVERMLRALGYRMLCADRARSALHTLESEHVDLLLVDSVMPGVSGEALVGEVGARWPQTRVLLMSGYADRARPCDALGRELPFIAKPFELAKLARSVRAVLDGTAPRQALAG